MVITPFISTRVGASVTPQSTLASGTYEISNVPAGKGRLQFANVSRVLSADLFPLNQNSTPASALRNFLTVFLGGNEVLNGTDSPYWYCYKGWLTTGLDPDGVTVSGTALKTQAFALYNAMPYAIKWGIFKERIADADTFDDYSVSQWLLPGNSVTLDGADSPQYYYYNGSPGGYSYDMAAGLCPAGGYLHAICPEFKGGFYDANSGSVRTDYLKILLVQGPAYGNPLS